MIRTGQSHRDPRAEAGGCCGGACGCRGMTGRERMLAALRQERVDRPPVWFMRQAGRHLPGYKAVRERLSFLEICRDVGANREVSSEPVKRYGLDAAIVFNDILVPLMDMGMELDFVPGPRFVRLVESAADAEALGTPRFGRETPVFRCIRGLREEVGTGTAVLGFIGAPFTVAAFAIAGAGPQRAMPLGDRIAVRPEAFVAMQERLVPVLAEYAATQVKAGADAVQIFESLAAEIDPGTYAAVGLPFLESVIAAVRKAVPGAPVIVFGRGIWEFIARIGAAGATVTSLDHTRPLSEARAALRRAGVDTGLQGNLPPETLLLPPGEARARAEALLSQWRSIVPRPEEAGVLGPTGWVFNLGHGVPENARLDSAQAAVDAVRSFRLSASSAGAPAGREVRS